MRLIGLAVMFAFCAFAPRPTEGQQTGKVYRVGCLSLESQSASLPETSGIGFNGLRRGLRDLGWIEGGNLLMGRARARQRPTILDASAGGVESWSPGPGVPFTFRRRYAENLLPLYCHLIGRQRAFAGTLCVVH